MNSHRRVNPFWVPLLVGLMSLTNVLTRPTMQSVRAVDKVQMLASGMCLGAALVMFAWFLRDRRQA